MKKISLAIIAAVLVASALAGCSIDIDNSSAASSSSSEVKNSITESSIAESSIAETTKEVSKEQVLYEKDGIKLTFLEYEEGYLPSLKFRIENSSDISYFITTDDVSINDSMISTGIFETVAPGKKTVANMTMFESDLKDNGIEKIEKVEFKLKYHEEGNYIDESREADIKFSV